MPTSTTMTAKSDPEKEAEVPFFVRVNICYNSCVFQSQKIYGLKIKLSVFPLLFNELYWQAILGLDLFVASSFVTS